MALPAPGLRFIGLGCVPIWLAAGSLLSIDLASVPRATRPLQTIDGSSGYQGAQLPTAAQLLVASSFELVVD